jgi:serine/threonine protein kinase
MIQKLRPDFYIDRNAISFLEGLMELDPDKRFTATQALQHPFLSISEE